jgi:hypothetical protein
LRNFEERANRFHAQFGGSGADSDSFWTSFLRTDRRRSYQHQSFEHDCGTKARYSHNSKCDSGLGSNNFSYQHIAEHAITGKHRDSNSANCFSYAADGLTDAGYCFSESEYNYDSERSVRHDCEPVRDAGYKRYGVQFDHRDSWIATSGKLEYARNNHSSARNYGIRNREPLPDDTAEPTVSEMNV